MRLLKVCIMIAGVLLCGTAFADTINWVGQAEDNSWSNPVNWDLGRVPGVADSVIINDDSNGWSVFLDDSADVSISDLYVGYGMSFYHVDTPPNLSLTKDLTIDDWASYIFETSIEEGKYNLDVGGALRIALSGNGDFYHDNGIVRTGELVLGGRSGNEDEGYDYGEGYYELAPESSQSMLEVARDLVVGEYGYGDFTQAGGTVDVGGDLYVGKEEESRGFFELSDEDNYEEGFVPALETRGQFIGYNGKGNFLQLGLTRNVLDGDLVLGHGYNSYGEYQLSGNFLFDGASNLQIGTKDVPANFRVGVQGYGKMLHEDGSAYVSGNLILGEMYDLDQSWERGGEYFLGPEDGGETYFMAFYGGPSLIVDGIEYIGMGGNGLFSQTSGANYANGGVFIASGAGSYGEYYMTGGGLTTPKLYVGGMGSGSFSQNGGTVNVGDELIVSSPYDEDSDEGGSSYQLNDGVLNKEKFEVKIGQAAGHYGYFEQWGGIFDNSRGAMYIGDYGIGCYDMYGGSLLNDEMSIGEWDGGYGEFRQAGWSSVTTNSLDVARQPGSFGYYQLYSLWEADYPELYSGTTRVGTKGNGEFEQYAGGHFIGDRLIIGDQAGSEGIYRLHGGDLNIVNEMIVQNQGKGVFEMSGGTVNVGGKTPYGEVEGTLTNNGSFTVQNGFTPAINAARIVNNGTMTVTNSRVEFNGRFVNNGALVSDPSELYFNDLEIGKNGYIQAGEDIYSVSGSFKNASERSGDWYTAQASLVFTPGIHDVMFNAIDKGGIASAWENNYAWGSVDFGGATFVLYSQADGRMGALYTGMVGGVQISGNTLLNFTGDGNIYYAMFSDPNLAVQVYNFASGSGKLIPMGVVPEPLSAGLFLIGGGALAVIRRRRK